MLLPADPPRGGRWADHRAVINGIFFRARAGCPWRDLPEGNRAWLRQRGIKGLIPVKEDRKKHRRNLASRLAVFSTPGRTPATTPWNAASASCPVPGGNHPLRQARADLQGHHRRCTGRLRPAGRPRPAAGPAARLPDPGDHHLRRLARRRPGTRRHHLAARLDPGHRPGQPRPPRPQPRHHPGPRRSRQPARPRTTQLASSTPARPARQPARRLPPRSAASHTNAGSRLQRAAPTAGPRPDAAQQRLGHGLA